MLQRKVLAYCFICWYKREPRNCSLKQLAWKLGQTEGVPYRDVLQVEHLDCLLVVFSSPAHRKLRKGGRRKLWQNGKGCHLEHIQTLVEHPLWVRRKHFVYTALSPSCQAFRVATIPIRYMRKPRIEKAT